MFKVGQQIVCIDNTPRDNRPETIEALSKIVVNETYVVRKIFDEVCSSIALEGITTPYSEKLGREIGYKSDRFRPLDSYRFAEDVLNSISEEIEEEIMVRLPNL
jgi:hypothetical protein